MDHVDDFDFHLPTELIAQSPSTEREKSRLLILDRQSTDRPFEEKEFGDIRDELHSGDVLVVNNAKVIPARIPLKRSGGGEAELFVLHPHEGEHTNWTASQRDTIWETLIRPAKWARKLLQRNEELSLDSSETILSIREECGGGRFLVTFERDSTPLNSIEVLELLNALGEIPLPPYIQREDGHSEKESDRERYQTVYAETPCAVAAPTAGLHFTHELLESLKEKGVEVATVTHQVGLGTFLPLRSEVISENQLHSEWSLLDELNGEIILRAKKENRRVIAVGTTSVRALESFGKSSRALPYHSSTELFIRPGFEFQIIDGLITNFHLPKSSLIILVSALASRDAILDAYQQAVRSKFRFFSYGDAMFIR